MQELSTLTETMRCLANALDAYRKSPDHDDPQPMADLTKQINRTIADGGVMAGKVLSEANANDETLAKDAAEAVNNFYNMRFQVMKLMEGKPDAPVLPVAGTA